MKLVGEYIVILPTFFDVGADYLLGISNLRNPNTANYDIELNIGLSRDEEDLLTD